MASSSRGTNPNRLIEVGNHPPNYLPYPPPTAEYSEVVANPQLFMSTLHELHTTMGTKFKIPIIGGKNLDLHHLFLEVTHRGGIDKILNERRWKEVTATFNFPSKATNASFTLRNHYVSLLQHYEQIYYFRAQGWTPSSSVSGSIPGPRRIPRIPYQMIEPVVPPQQPVRPPIPLQPRIAAAEPSRATATTSALPVGTSVMGVIDRETESGYLVTITIGSEKFKGVLYHIPSLINPSQSQSTSAAATVGVVQRRYPSRPKSNRSGYNFFFAEQRPRLKDLHAGTNKEISQMIGNLWTNLEESQKSVYQERADKDKERYNMDMIRYRESLNTVIRNAAPLQQRRIEDMVMEVDDDEEDGDSPQTPYETSSDEDSTPPRHGGLVVGESSNDNAEKTRNIPGNVGSDTTEQGH